MIAYRSFVLASLVLVAGVLCGCNLKVRGPAGADDSSAESGSLVEARKSFQTRLARRTAAREPAEEPPARLFRKVHYEAPVGKLVAYLSPDPGDKKKHPAIIWITGGDCNSIGDVWTSSPPSNDQAARAYRKAGIVMFFPSLRGGNDNPGVREGFLGEVDDVLAAADFLATQSYVDPARIYLGGHSTGGTLVLLVAECTGRFRATFSFGPVADVSAYGSDSVWTPFDSSNPEEIRLRSPVHWMAGISSPTFVFEGTTQPANDDSLDAMAARSTNSNLHFYPVRGTDHFSVLAPVNRFLAERILKDDGPKCELAFTEDELNRAARK